jgi:hypothetical protein
VPFVYFTFIFEPLHLKPEALNDQFSRLNHYNPFALNHQNVIEMPHLKLPALIRLGRTASRRIVLRGKPGGPSPARRVLLQRSAIRGCSNGAPWLNILRPFKSAIA